MLIGTERLSRQEQPPLAPFKLNNIGLALAGQLMLALKTAPEERHVNRII
jgi:hypothetical protein